MIQSGSLYHCSSLRSIQICAVHARLARPAVRVLFVHGGRAGHTLGGTIRPLAAALCRSFSQLWVTNQAMADELRRMLPADLGARIAVVAPVDLDRRRPVARGLPTAGSAYAAVLAVGGSVDLYGLSVGLASIVALQAADVSATLEVLVYGDAEVEAVKDLCRALGPSVVISEGRSPDSVDRLLERADVLLRPTTTDGDAVIVRQALAAGARVVASDVVPRPLGCEVAPVEKFSEAVLLGGAAVETDELGISLGIAIQELTGGKVRKR